MKALFWLNWLFISVAAAAGVAWAAPLSDTTQECLDCHVLINPGIVKDWESSRHASVTPKTAMAAEALSRKVSSPSVPDPLLDVAVGCAECHTLRPQAHADTFEHNGYEIHVVVSPADCRTCHSEEANQYDKNIMAHAWNNLAGNEVYKALERSIIGQPALTGDTVSFKPADADTRAEACYYCHGTRLEVTGTEMRDTDAGELEFPVIAGWPNQGVGRINLDGSRGACSACHTRHGFSIEMARKPYTCKECHIGPDVPAFKVYSASKHGNIASAMGDQWNFKAVPWTVGSDFTAPTCAACHVSLLVNDDGEPIVPRTHQMNNRLAWRLFGLIYAHPHPLSPDTTIIRNAAGLPLPTDFDGTPASAHLIDPNEQARRTRAMQAICLGCHDTSWVKGHWRRFENTIRTTNADVHSLTRIMTTIWAEGWASGLAAGANPFDEAVEKQWADAWLFYANTIRFASAMAGGGDYGVFADGRYALSRQIVDLQDWLTIRRHMGSSLKPANRKPND